MKPPDYIASFDSAMAMLRALSRFLHGQDFPLTGALPPKLEPVMLPVALLVNKLPRRVRESVYIWSGRSEAIPAEKLGQVRAEQVSEWMVGHYPTRRYPAVMIGSSNGALVHLCAALGIPWLPQTYLIPVRRSGVSPDEPARDMEWGSEQARPLLEANPELELHHMHDPNQDRLMVQRMTYFRVKRLRLGRAYERFLEENLAPSGTIYLVDCGLTWPTTEVGERHIFQFGALGGATPEEYLRGGPRVEEYLQRHGSALRRWEPPRPDGHRPEAEWGFQPELGRDIERLARERGYRLRRIAFDQPEDVSPLVADFHRWWYMGRGLPTSRLLIETFIQLEPWWALRTGSVPFWMVFSVEPSAGRLEQYLDRAEPYDQIHMMLFSHGVNSIGLASIERWRALLARARQGGEFIGVDVGAYPRDFATFVRYHTSIKRIPTRYAMPGSAGLAQLDTFLEQAGATYAVTWLEREWSLPAHPPHSAPSGPTPSPSGRRAGGDRGRAVGG